MSTESTQWRKFLQPVVTGLVALMAAGVGYLQYLQKQDGERLKDSREAESVVTYLCKREKFLAIVETID